MTIFRKDLKCCLNEIVFMQCFFKVYLGIGSDFDKAYNNVGIELMVSQVTYQIITENQ